MSIIGLNKSIKIYTPIHWHIKKAWCNKSSIRKNKLVMIYSYIYNTYVYHLELFVKLSKKVNGCSGNVVMLSSLLYYKCNYLFKVGEQQVL